MKQILLIMVLAAGTMMLGGCKEKKQTGDIITTKYVPKKPQPPIAMPQDRQVLNVGWVGRNYEVAIVRTSVDSLPMVADDTGQKYIDNSVTISIKRADGSMFFEKTFVKGSFASYIDANFRKNGLLASIRFDEVDGPEMEFSVVIGLPDAVDDVYVPLELTINSQGGISIKQDDDMGLRDFDDDGDD